MEYVLPYLTLLLSVIAFSFAAWRYLDTRRREIHQRRFDQFHRVFVWVAGKTETGNPLVNTQQALAVYELGEFPEYRRMALPIIEYYLEMTKNDSDGSLFRQSLLTTRDRLIEGGNKGIRKPSF